MDASSVPISGPRGGGLLIAAWGLVVLAYAVGFFLASGTTLGRRLEELVGGSGAGRDKGLHFTGFFLLAPPLFPFFLSGSGREGASATQPPPWAAFSVVGEGPGATSGAGQALFPG